MQTNLSIFSFNAGSISSSISPSSNSTISSRLSSFRSCSFNVKLGLALNLLTSSLGQTNLRLLDSYNIRGKGQRIINKFGYLTTQAEMHKKFKRKLVIRTSWISLASYRQVFFCWSFLLRFFFLFLEVLIPLESVKQNFLTSNEAFKRK